VAGRPARPSVGGRCARAPCRCRGPPSSTSHHQAPQGPRAHDGSTSVRPAVATAACFDDHRISPARSNAPAVVDRRATPTTATTTYDDVRARYADQSSESRETRPTNERTCVRACMHACLAAYPVDGRRPWPQWQQAVAAGYSAQGAGRGSISSSSSRSRRRRQQLLQATAAITLVVVHSTVRGS
jgi:hypothetical protein